MRREVEKTEYEYPDVSDEKRHDYWVRHMYTLHPAPPRRKLEEYIGFYRESGDELYFQFFLHFYEPRLNRHVEYTIGTYSLQLCHFLDLKQTVVETLLRKLPEYDPAFGTTLEQFARRYIREAEDEYIRLHTGSFSETSQTRYRAMRRANAIYYGCGDWREGIRAVTEQTKLSNERAWQLIEEGTAFRYPKSLDEPSKSEDAYTGEELDCESYPEDFRSPVPDIAVPRMMFMQEVTDAMETLPERQQRMIYDSCGIACIYCGRTKQKMSYEEIADEWELYGESAVEKQRKAAIRKVRKLMKEKGY